MLSEVSKMIDVEKMKKMNFLIKELQKHGIAKSSEDALAKAEIMVDREKSFSEEPAEESHSVVAENNESRQMNVLERNYQNMSNQLSLVKQQMLCLGQEIARMRQEFAQHKHQVPAESTVVREEPKEQPEAEEKKEESHPRSGEYSSSDVSIEKFFYCGKS